MNLIQLRYFQAVCACGNLTQAAQQLHISQPSLSSAIQTLEKEFGVGLFVRQYRGVELTAEGEQLLKLSRSLTENADKLVRIMQDLGAGRHILRLGVPPVLGGWLLPRLYTDFFATMRSSVWKSWKSGGRSSRKSWNMNFWILPSLFIHSPYTVDLSPFLSRTLNQEPSSPELIPLQGKSPASGKPICGKLVLMPELFFQSELVEERFRKAGQEPQILCRTSQLYTMIQLVKMAGPWVLAIRKCF